MMQKKDEKRKKVDHSSLNTQLHHESPDFDNSTP